MIVKSLIYCLHCTLTLHLNIYEPGYSDWYKLVILQVDAEMLCEILAYYLRNTWILHSITKTNKRWYHWSAFVKQSNRWNTHSINWSSLGFLFRYFTRLLFCIGFVYPLSFAFCGFVVVLLFCIGFLLILLFILFFLCSNKTQKSWS